MSYEVVHVKTQEEWDLVWKHLENGLFPKVIETYGECVIYLDRSGFDRVSTFDREPKRYKKLSFNEWCENNNYLNKNKEEKSMEKNMLDVLNKTYDNLILRRKTIPLFMSNPGIGKSTIIRKFAETKGVKMKKITLSQRMPNEVVGMMMPIQKVNEDKTISNNLEVFDSNELSLLEDGDILFFDEVFNGTLKQTLDAVLNLLEDRKLPSGKRLADVMIVAASNPQGLINLTPQIKERFIRYDLKFSPTEFQELLKKKYGMPESISSHISTLINKEKFDQVLWDYVTPRSVEKAINQIGCDLESPYNDVLIPFLSKEIVSPMAIESIAVKQGDNIPYISLLKLIIQNNNKKEKELDDTKNR